MTTFEDFNLTETQKKILRENAAYYTEMGARFKAQCDAIIAAHVSTPSTPQPIAHTSKTYLQKIRASVKTPAKRLPPVLPTPSRVIVEISPYVREHGKSPRGYGNWGFSPDKYADLKTCKWVTGTFSEAKRAGQQWAAGMGFDVIYVQSWPRQSTRQNRKENSRGIRLCSLL